MLLDSLCLSAAVAAGQVGGAAAEWPPPPPAVPRAAAAAPADVAPAAAPVVPGLPPLAPALFQNTPATPAPAAPAETTPPAVTVNGLPTSKEAEEDQPSPEADTPVRPYFLMRELQGTWLGSLMHEHRLSASGWFTPSYTASTKDFTNQPFVWNDRPDRFLLQQAWFRLERSVVTEGTTSPTWGFRVDMLYGSDYRFSLPRGLLNSQLLNSRAQQALDEGDSFQFQRNQNLYGIDPIQFYVNTYIPTLFQGTDIRVGRLYTPFGYESLEAVSTPLVSRSYAFNWCPPFTHMGLMGTFNLSPEWQVKAMLANGNDVFFDPSQEARFVGAVTYTHPNKQDVVTFGTTLGRGQFNSGDPFAPQTVGLMSEDSGRNNINVFDLVWIHTFNPTFSYGAEVIYGYQSGVPSTLALDVDGGTSAVGRIISNDVLSGTAHWGSFVQYFNYNFCPQLTGIFRFELFDDFEGQRTGFEGLYTSSTLGFQVKPSQYPGLIIRPEVRYDFNNESRAFEGKYDIFAFSVDAIIRY